MSGAASPVPAGVRPSRRQGRARRLLLGSLLGLFVLAGAGLLVRRASTPGPGQVSYHLRWAWGRARPVGSGWETTNDLGYKVRIESGYLVSHGVALIACAPEARAPGACLRERLAMAWPGLKTRPVLAGHSSGHREPTQLDRPTVEDLAAPVATALGELRVERPAPSYCQAHYAIGLSAAEAERLDAPTELAGGTLFLAGSYRRGDDDPRPFTVRSALAWGAVHDLVAPASVAPGPDGAQLEVDVVRDLGASLDGIDFARMSPEQVASGTLAAIAEGTRFELAAAGGSP